MYESTCPEYRQPSSKSAPQQRRLVHARQQQHVSRDRRFDQRVEHVAPPAPGLADERRRARVAAEVQVLVQREAEGRAHLRERPVRQAQHLESPGQALGQALLDEERRRAEQHHLERHAGRVCPRPTAASPISDQPVTFCTSSSTSIAPASRFPRRQPRALPLRRDPVGVAQRWFVGAGDSAPVRSRRATTCCTSVVLPTCRGFRPFVPRLPGSVTFRRTPRSAMSSKVEETAR